jgi:hypothetical protein
MTTGGPDLPLTAADLLFGSSADVPEALTRQIVSAGRAQSLGRALERLPRVTREAAIREAAAAAAGLLKVDLIEVLVTGWREHRDVHSAARRTLDTPGSKELVGLAPHRIKTVQQPAVSILIDDRRVHTLQLGLSIIFEVTGLVAGISAGRLDGIHAGRCEIGVALTVHEIEVLTKRAHHLELPGVMALRSGFRLLPGSEYPRGEHPHSEHPSSQKFPGSEHPASQFPGVELLSNQVAGPQVPVGDHAGTRVPVGDHAGTRVPVGDHAGTQVSLSDLAGSQNASSEHSSSQVPGSEHPSSGEGDHPSAPVPWWESVKSVPPPSRPR